MKGKMDIRESSIPDIQGQEGLPRFTVHFGLPLFFFSCCGECDVHALFFTETLVLTLEIRILSAHFFFLLCQKHLDNMLMIMTTNRASVHVTTSMVVGRIRMSSLASLQESNISLET